MAFNEQEPNPEDEGFTTKMRLNIPEQFDVGDKNQPINTQSKVESWEVTGIGRTNRHENREFKTRPGNVDANCYFMLIEREGENTAMVVPVSHHITMDPVIPKKTGINVLEPRAESNDNIVAERLERIVKSEDKSSMNDHKIGNEGGYGTGGARSGINNFSWDFDGAPSDDEELYPQIGHEEDEDPLKQPNLTVYGQKMRSLLQQQMEREVDEELREYSDGDDGSQVSASGKNPRTQDPLYSQSSKKSKTEGEKNLSIEERVMRYLRQNNGKVPVKGVLSHFNITAKNEEFRIIQREIQKRCTMSTEDRGGVKIKYIALKPEYQ
ncbi:hypothetical protein X943_000949 [Babesia divergens]|uniref:Uncharacterized protein n=1 Tax=Babesia divergens TaxID=32595 RepID=A0AAD9GAD7_BABDI|nr:hypothetical protein X943_000949 [Babesia divergens]